MNTREMHAEVTRLAKERGWPESSQMETHLLTLMSAREDAREGLRNKIQALRSNLNRLENVLRAESPILNTLGELQGQPSAIEASVGEFATADKALRNFLETFPAGKPELAD